MRTQETDDTPGWDALDAALAQIYGTTEPRSFGTIVGWRLGGPDPLDQILAYPCDNPTPHWHFVSYGMSELYDKESDNREVSGWGFEFTFRLARPLDQTEPPNWALSFLQNLGRYVYESGNVFDPGDHMDLNGPIALDHPNTLIRAIGIAPDPRLGELTTTNGRLRFLQIVGLTPDEHEVAKSWRTAGVLELMAANNPLLITDLDRDSIRADPATRAAIAELTDREGPSTGSLFVDKLGWKSQRDGTVDIQLGALSVSTIRPLLAGRLRAGNELLLLGPEQPGANRRVVLSPGATYAAEFPEEDLLKLTVPPAVFTELAAVLQPAADRHQIQAAPGLTIEIVRSQVRNGDGEVVQTIG